MSDYLEKLNSAQREAVTCTEGYVRVVAGAGSGKTRALSTRFAWLVNDLGILPGHILCVTFTNRAANEMRERIHRMTGDRDTGYINTFHGFCVNFLKEESYAIHYPKNFIVLDNGDIDGMLDVIYAEAGLTMRDMTYGNARDMFEMIKLVEKPDYYLDLLDLSLDELRKKYLSAKRVKDILFYGYLYMEKKCFGLDYNDLIKCTLHILREREEIRDKWQQRLEYIMIEEFQDIDPPQYELMEELCGKHGNLFVVGDPDQTIYTWRGADIRYLLDFAKKFTPCRTVMMMENYRSSPEILAAANSLISRNRNRLKKEMIPTLPGRAKPEVFHGKSGEDEAAWIAARIAGLHEAGVPYTDITVLYRAHYVSRNIEDAFLKAQIPYNIYSGVQFFQRAEVKDALAYLRMVAVGDDPAFRRVVNVPRRNIGRTRMKYLEALAAERGCTLYEALEASLDDEQFKNTKARAFVSLVKSYRRDAAAGRSVSDLLSAVLNESGYEKMLRTEGSQERLDNVAELKQAVWEYEQSAGEDVSAEGFLAQAALFTNLDTPDTKDKVRLMTVHAAKGLEFPHVFICGLNEGIFPSRKVRTIQAMEEERRLAFVALTRAMDGLYLTESEGKNHDGTFRYPSRFVLDIDAHLLDFREPLPESLVREARDHIAVNDALLTEEDAEQKYLSPGERVKHPVFGPGTVEEVDLEKSAYVVKFDGLPTTRAITFRVRLEKL